MNNDFFDISGDTIAAAEAAADFRLAVPATARDGKDGGKFWTEHGTITRAWSEKYTKKIGDEEMPIQAMHIEMTLDGLGSQMNDGRVFRTSMRLNAIGLKKGAGLPKGNPLKGQHTMTTMSIAKLKNLFRAMGVEPDGEDGGFSAALQLAAFPPVDSFSGETSFLEGRTNWVEVSQKDVPKKTGTGTFTQIEVNKFLGEEQP